jgi:hypothetical protein
MQLCLMCQPKERIHPTFAESLAGLLGLTRYICEVRFFIGQRSIWGLVQRSFSR